MGNCLHVVLHPSEKCRVFVYGEGEQEFRPSTRVKKIISGRYRGYKLVNHALPYAPLPPNSKLEPGEVYYLVPPAGEPPGPQVSSKLQHEGETCGKRKVKIVLTRKQLELLLSKANQLKTKQTTILQLFDSMKGGGRKWQPSLATIAEEQKCLISG